MLKTEWSEIRVIEKEQLLIKRAKEEIIEKIKKLEVKDDKTVKVLEEMKMAGVKVLRNDKWQIEDELVLKEGKIYILKNNSLRLKIIWLYHDMPIVEHGRQQKIVELITRNYWQSGVTKEVKQYIKGYDQCQRIKNKAEILTGKLRL